MTFDPEIRERREMYREKQIISPDLEEKIKERLRKHETYADIVYCPNQKCATPITIINEPDTIILKCKNCGFERVIQKTTQE